MKAARVLRLVLLIMPLMGGGCTIHGVAGPPPVSVEYVPPTYEGHVIYYYRGDPVYYEQGRRYYVPRSYYRYDGYVDHYRRHRREYRRWERDNPPPRRRRVRIHTDR